MGADLGGIVKVYINDNMDKKYNINELIDQAVAVWRNEGMDPMDGDTSFYNLHKDPITRLLLGAVAHQKNVLSDEMDGFLNDLLEQYVTLGTPDYLLQALPAMAMLQTGKTHKKGNTNEARTEIDGSISFIMKKPDPVSRESYMFVPLLRMAVLDLSVDSVTKIGKGMWRLRLEEKEYMETLSGLSIYLPKVSGCSEVRLYTPMKPLQPTSPSQAGMQALPLIDISGSDANVPSLPFTDIFLGGMQLSRSSQHCVVLQNLYDMLCCYDGAYCIVDNNAKHMPITRDDGCVVLDIELVGVDAGFELKKEDVLLNCVPVFNAVKHTASLTREQPFCHLDLQGQQFFTTITNDTVSEAVQLRCIGTERMSSTLWKQRMKTLVDYYDAEHIVLGASVDEKVAGVMQQFMAGIHDSLTDERMGKIFGMPDDAMYLVLKDQVVSSMDVLWLSTQGAAANGLDKSTKVEPCTAELDANQTCLLTTTAGGRDTVRDREKRHRLMKYYGLSKDRIVSKADIIAFCRFKLTEQFGVTESEISDIRLRTEITNTNAGFFERVVVVEIRLTVSLSNAPQIGRSLERMVASRTMGTAPVRIGIY